jgi:hypothetical protein
MYQNMVYFLTFIFLLLKKSVNLIYMKLVDIVSSLIINAEGIFISVSL